MPASWHAKYIRHGVALARRDPDHFPWTIFGPELWRLKENAMITCRLRLILIPAARGYLTYLTLLLLASQRRKSSGSTALTSTSRMVTLDISEKETSWRQKENPYKSYNV